MYVMQVHVRTGWVSVADLEKMLAKVQGILGDVSLYHKCALGWSVGLLVDCLVVRRHARCVGSGGAAEVACG